MIVRWRRCRQIRRELQTFLDGETDMPQTRQIAAHLAICVRCGLEAASLRQVIADLRRSHHTPSTAATHRLTAALDALAAHDATDPTRGRS
ncbi:MAG: zf-HC2 domain-containing protein [Nitriliruptoraceae bacterium]